MNVKIGGNKVNPFSVGNPVADLGDAIVGTYGPSGSGQCEQCQPPIDIGGSVGPIILPIPPRRPRVIIPETRTDFV